MLSQPVRVVGLVSYDNGTSLEVCQEHIGTRQIVGLAGRYQDLDRPALPVDAGVDLGREPAATASHTTISTLFLTPEAC